MRLIAILLKPVLSIYMLGANFTNGIIYRRLKPRRTKDGWVLKDDSIAIGLSFFAFGILIMYVGYRSTHDFPHYSSDNWFWYSLGGLSALGGIAMLLRSERVTFNPGRGTVVAAIRRGLFVRREEYSYANTFLTLHPIRIRIRSRIRRSDWIGFAITLVYGANTMDLAHSKSLQTLSELGAKLAGELQIRFVDRSNRKWDLE